MISDRLGRARVYSNLVEIQNTFVCIHTSGDFSVRKTGPYKNYLRSYETLKLKFWNNKLKRPIFWNYLSRFGELKTN